MACVTLIAVTPNAEVTMAYVARVSNPVTQQTTTADDCPLHLVDQFQARIKCHLLEAEHLYRDMLSQGIAKECARAILPQCTSTTLYMTGNCLDSLHPIAH